MGSQVCNYIYAYIYKKPKRPEEHHKHIKKTHHKTYQPTSYPKSTNNLSASAALRGVGALKGVPDSHYSRRIRAIATARRIRVRDRDRDLDCIRDLGRLHSQSRSHPHSFFLIETILVAPASRRARPEENFRFLRIPANLRSSPGGAEQRRTVSVGAAPAPKRGRRRHSRRRLVTQNSRI